MVNLISDGIVQKKEIIVDAQTSSTGLGGLVRKKKWWGFP